ncbi:MAG: ClpX C4-type zinc finger protein [Bryobacteraceae bacterium]
MGGRRASKELRCSFCGEEGSLQTLISSPADYSRAYICYQCVARCTTALAGLPAPSGHRPVNAPGCSFCHRGPDVEKLVPAPGNPPEALICEGCLAVCSRVLEDDLESEDQDQGAES